MSIDHDPTCARCGADTETKAWVAYWRGDELLRTLCVDCSDGENLDEFGRTGRVTSSLHLAAAIRSHRDPASPYAAVMEAMKPVSVAVKDFEYRAWLGGLREQVRASNARGMKAGPIPTSSGPVTLMTYCLAGREMATIEGDGFSVTVIADGTSDCPRMGLQGISAHPKDAIAALEGVRDAVERFAVTLGDDDKVGML